MKTKAAEPRKWLDLTKEEQHDIQALVLDAIEISPDNRYIKSIADLRAAAIDAQVIYRCFEGENAAQILIGMRRFNAQIGDRWASELLAYITQCPSGSPESGEQKPAPDSPLRSTIH